MSHSDDPVLAAIVAAPRAWSDCSGHPTTALRALELAGYVERWAVGPETYWTITPWGAAVLRVELVEVGTAEVPRWAEAGTEPPPIVARKWPGERPLPFPERVPDRDAPEPCPDPINSGEQLTLFAQRVPVWIDRRMRRQPGKRRQRRKRPA